MNKPNDSRNFVHKRIFGAAKGFATGGFGGAALGFVTGGGRKSGGGRAVRGGRIMTTQVPTRARTTTTQQGRGGLLGALIGRGRTTTTTFAAPPAATTAAAVAAVARSTGQSMASVREQMGIAKPRRMNVVNPKALRRATRRVNGFVKVATRALEGTGWKVVRRTSSKRTGPKVIVESGPGSVVSR